MKTINRRSIQNPEACNLDDFARKTGGAYERGYDHAHDLNYDRARSIYIDRTEKLFNDYIEGFSSEWVSGFESGIVVIANQCLGK